MGHEADTQRYLAGPVRLVDGDSLRSGRDRLLYPDHHDPVRHRRLADRRRTCSGRSAGRSRCAGTRASASLIGNIIWIILVGWELALGHLTAGILLCLTIIGIPLGLANFKLIPISLLPLGVRIVRSDELYPGYAGGRPADYAGQPRY